MKNRKNLPVAALRAFEAAARHGQLTAAADELAVTHGAISRHVSHLEALIGTQLFEGARNRPRLTTEGRVFGLALTAAFDQIEEAFRLIGRGDEGTLDVACLSTFAMRWLIPHLHDFSSRYPSYDVRLATDDRPPRTAVDVQIMVIDPESALPQNSTLMFQEQLGLVAAPSLIGKQAWMEQRANEDKAEHSSLPRLETRTRPNVWAEWARLTGAEMRSTENSSRMFDHYHLTIEAALNGLGLAIVPWHLVAGDVACGRLVALSGFLQSGYRYVAKVERPGRRKTEHFVGWLKDVVKAFPAPTSEAS